jgi:hypothetical protein
VIWGEGLTVNADVGLSETGTVEGRTDGCNEGDSVGVALGLCVGGAVGDIDWVGDALGQAVEGETEWVPISARLVGPTIYSGNDLLNVHFTALSMLIWLDQCSLLIEEVHEWASTGNNFTPRHEIIIEREQIVLNQNWSLWS